MAKIGVEGLNKGDKFMVGDSCVYTVQRISWRLSFELGRVNETCYATAQGTDGSVIEVVPAFEDEPYLDLVSRA